ncbi:MAG TPA: hypothetical protein VGN20_28095 [Mucilaginibacter sp.]|jgi:tetratricopeptide (TPR) repeat protein
MSKKTFLILSILFVSRVAFAQSAADSVYNKYLDFNLARLQGEQDKITELGNEIIPNANKLPEKARINFYFSVGKMYEDNDQPGKALPYYEKVAAAVPDYYVVHRALGYLYLDDVKAIEKKLNAAQTDKALNDKLAASYEKAVRKTLPHLEKAQACDPSDETLTIIKLLYKNIKDTNGLNSLDTRLKTLNQNCIDILDDH